VFSLSLYDKFAQFSTQSTKLHNIKLCLSWTVLTACSCQRRMIRSWHWVNGEFYSAHTEWTLSGPNAKLTTCFLLREVTLGLGRVRADWLKYRIPKGIIGKKIKNTLPPPPRLMRLRCKIGRYIKSKLKIFVFVYLQTSLCCAHEKCLHIARSTYCILLFFREVENYLHSNWIARTVGKLWNINIWQRTDHARKKIEFALQYIYQINPNKYSMTLLKYNHEK
jgi:hypothetical protein